MLGESFFLCQNCCCFIIFLEKLPSRLPPIITLARKAVHSIHPSVHHRFVCAVTFAVCVCAGGTGWKVSNFVFRHLFPPVLDRRRFFSFLGRSCAELFPFFPRYSHCPIMPQSHFLQHRSRQSSFALFRIHTPKNGERMLAPFLCQSYSTHFLIVSLRVDSSGKTREEEYNSLKRV